MPLIALFSVGLFAYLFREDIFGKKKRPAYARNARWSRKTKNVLPDSAFLYVAPGGKKVREDGMTVTVPRSKRKFPYKRPSGEVDLPHLRNALARIGRSSIPEREKAALETKARKILALATGRPYSKLEARAAKAKARRRRELRKAA
jgi:hypothetical protein